MTSTRKAKRGDVESICSCDHIAQEDDGRKEFIRRAVASGDCFVALKHDKIVGYGVLEYWFYGNGIVSMLMVHPEHRRQGIGNALMEHMEKNCATKKLFTSTNQSNIPMQSLLANLGCQPSGRVENLDEDDPELIYFKMVCN